VLEDLAWQRFEDVAVNGTFKFDDQGIQHKLVLSVIKLMQKLGRERLNGK